MILMYSIICYFELQYIDNLVLYSIYTIIQYLHLKVNNNYVHEALAYKKLFHFLAHLVHFEIDEGPSGSFHKLDKGLLF